MISSGDKIGLVCCSNGKTLEDTSMMEALIEALEALGIHAKLSKCMYATKSVFAGSGKERARAMMDFYKDSEIKAIMDISGGDVANMVLPYLDYDVIVANPKPFWGYSDLTTVLNAIYAKTGNVGVLYQMMNLVWDESGVQRKRLQRMLSDDGEIRKDLCNITYDFLQGTSLDGVVIGGNIRCFLKLAGTEFFPDLEGKILLLEGLGGSVAQYATYLAQLDMLCAFEKVSGVLLGTFTQMEKDGCTPSVEDMLFDILRRKENARVRELPVAKTKEIGHGVDAKGILIGERLIMDKNLDFFPYIS